MCIRCDNPDQDLKMSFWRELTLCSKHRQEWKEYKKTMEQKFKIIDEAYDRLLKAIDDERASRKQIGKP